MKHCIMLLILLVQIQVANAASIPSPSSAWTETERWVWQKITAGEIANLDEFCTSSGTNTKKKDNYSRSECSTLRSLFFEDVLTRDPWRNSITKDGVRVLHAFIPHDLDLQNSNITTPLWIQSSYINGELRLYDSKAAFPVLLSGSTIHGINAERAHFESAFRVHNSAVVFKNVNLTNSKIDGSLDLERAAFGNVTAQGVTVAQDLTLWKSTVTDSISLAFANIGTYLDMQYGKFNSISLNAAQINGSVLLRNDTVVTGNLDISYAKIGSALAMHGSKFSSITAFSVDIGDTALLNNATFSGDIIFTSGKIGGNVTFNGSQLHSLGLNSLSVSKSLLLNNVTAIKGDLDLQAAVVKGTLEMNNSNFNTIKAGSLKVDDNVSLKGTIVKKSLTFNKSSIGGFLDMDGGIFKEEASLNSIRVGHSLHIRNATVQGKLDLQLAEVKDNVALDNSIFNKIMAGGSKIGFDLTMMRSKVFGELKLNMASVGSSLNMGNGNFQNVNLNSIQVQQGIFINSNATVSGELDLQMAQIKANIQMDDSRFNIIKAGGINTGGNVSLYKSEVNGTLNLNMASVGSSLDMGNGNFQNVNLNSIQVQQGIFINSNATVSGELDLQMAHANGNIEMDTSCFAIIEANAAKIGGNISLNNSTIHDGIYIQKAIIGSSLLMNYAYFRKNLNLYAIRVGKNFFFNNSTVVDGEFNLQDSVFGGSLDLSYSTLNSTVNADFIHVGSGLDMIQSSCNSTLSLMGASVTGPIYVDASTLQDVDFYRINGNNYFMLANTSVKSFDVSSANISGYLYIFNSTFGSIFDSTLADNTSSGLCSDCNANFLDATGVRVGGLLMVHDSNISCLDISGGIIGDSIKLSTSLFNTVDAHSIHVANDLYIYGNTTIDNSLILKNSAIDGSLQFENSTISIIQACNLHCKGDVKFYCNSTVRGDLCLSYAQIGGSLSLTVSNFEKEVDCTSMQLDGNLILGLSQEFAPRWDSNSSLVLRNAKVYGIRSFLFGISSDKLYEDAFQSGWPQAGRLTLTGLKYSLIPYFKSVSNMSTPSAASLEYFLSLNSEFSPQPYLHLASLLRAYGHIAISTSILEDYYSILIHNSLSDGNLLLSAWILLLKAVANNGQGIYAFRILLWILLFAAVGYRVLIQNLDKRTKFRGWYFFASLHKLLPVLSLGKEFSDFFESANYSNRSAIVKYYFIFHSIAGFFLGLTLLAGVTGLLQGSLY
ncbi:hypothetical protein [Megalodesulfovibrio gigas]|uniref:hypothetical protein n=1 Tax=Megalodesulfovibrio gigas TaxID=879 RepID=UPI000402BB4F|nr:hypothetical protein [Megalodesulfovibrio gigas]